MSMCIYAVCVVPFVGRVLVSCRSPVQGVLPTTHRTKKQKSRQVPTMDCRAIDNKRNGMCSVMLIWMTVMS
jgi:hypothetical protein